MPEHILSWKENSDCVLSSKNGFECVCLRPNGSRWRVSCSRIFDWIAFGTRTLLSNRHLRVSLDSAKTISVTHLCSSEDDVSKKVSSNSFTTIPKTEDYRCRLRHDKASFLAETLSYFHSCSLKQRLKFVSHFRLRASFSAACPKIQTSGRTFWFFSITLSVKACKMHPRAWALRI